MVTQTQKKPAAAKQPLVGPFQGQEALPQDGQPIVDLDPETIDPQEIEGSEVMPRRADAPPNTVSLGDQHYPLPRFGPLVLARISRIQQDISFTEQRQSDLLKMGYSADDAQKQSGYGDAMMRFLGFILDSFDGVIPGTVLMGATTEEVSELANQIRPFDANAVAPST